MSGEAFVLYDDDQGSMSNGLPDPTRSNYLAQSQEWSLSMLKTNLEVRRYWQNKSACFSCGEPVQNYGPQGALSTTRKDPKAENKTYPNLSKKKKKKPKISSLSNIQIEPE